jgi:hypothetical protein
VRSIILLSAGPALALLDLARVVQDGLIGAGIGAVAGRVVISRRERRGGELKGQRIRQIEVNWTLALAFFAVLGRLGFGVAFN